MGAFIASTLWGSISGQPFQKPSRGHYRRLERTLRQIRYILSPVVPLLLPRSNVYLRKGPMKVLEAHALEVTMMGTSAEGGAETKITDQKKDFRDKRKPATF